VKNIILSLQPLSANKFLEKFLEKFLKKYFKNVAEVKIKSTFAVPIQTGKRSEKFLKKITKMLQK
jgi:hypothetical protein